MYDSWYERSLDDQCDTFSDEYEIFGIVGKNGDPRLTALKRLESGDILDWAKSEDPSSDTYGRMRLIFTRHRKHQQHEIKPWYMAFRKDEFKKLAEMMKFPPDYLFLRRGAGGCGAFQKHTTRNQDGSVSLITFTIRVPHSPRINTKAVWSIALTWSAKQCTTSALFESLSDEDIQEVHEYILASQAYLIHPFTIPTILASLLTTFYIEHRRQFQGSLYVLEHQLGITRGEREADAWDWGFELHRESTKHCHRIQTSLIYLERQLQFAIGLCSFVLACLKDFEEEDDNFFEHKNELKVLGRRVKENVTNTLNLATSQHQQTLCLQKRCQALITVIYTIIAQQDSQVNVKISTAAKKDSTSMTTIAILGIVFLPAMLIASMFSMSMFNFSNNSTSSPNNVAVAPGFWIYWAVTVPLTLAVLSIWRVWMRLTLSSTKTSQSKDEFLKRDWRMIFKKIHDASNSQLTPFYPSKEAQVSSSRLCNVGERHGERDGESSESV